jgi:hypothetical protein
MKRLMVIGMWATALLFQAGDSRADGYGASSYEYSPSILASSPSSPSSSSLSTPNEWGYCHLEGNVPDCDCDFTTVNGAVKNFLAPLLKDLTSR